MFNLAQSFEHLWRQAFDQKIYEKELQEVGSTRAGIALQARIDALSHFVQEHGEEIIQVLHKGWNV